MYKSEKKSSGDAGYCPPPGKCPTPAPTPCETTAEVVCPTPTPPTPEIAETGSQVDPMTALGLSLALLVGGGGVLLRTRRKPASNDG